MKQNKKNLLIIGDLYIDVHLDHYCETGVLYRFGGILHSVRACKAAGCTCSIAYYGPSYLQEHLQNYCDTLGCVQQIYCIGVYKNKPKIILIQSSQEFFSQGYSEILNESPEVSESLSLIDIVNETSPSDILIYPGDYNLEELLNIIANNEKTASLHIDMHYGSDDLIYSGNIETIIYSTSSKIFSSTNNIEEHIASHFPNAKTYLIKENLGGSHLYDLIEKVKYDIPAFFQPDSQHSVGVGDAYNTIYISLVTPSTILQSLILSSYIASVYSCTFNDESFFTDSLNILKYSKDYSELPGLRLPWSSRKIDIYLAAPDFPHIQKDILDRVEKSLLHHNFIPHRPIKENGLATENTNQNYKLYLKDRALLEKCKLLIAVILEDDPGTYTEIGIFNQMSKPIIIFDPYKKCFNMFTTLCACVVCTTLEEVIKNVFLLLGKKQSGVVLNEKNI